MCGKSIMHVLICYRKACDDNSGAYMAWYPNEHIATRQQIHHGVREAQRSPVSPIRLSSSSGVVARIWHRASIMSTPCRPGRPARPESNSRNTRSGRAKEPSIPRACLSAPCLLVSVVKSPFDPHILAGNQKFKRKNCLNETGRLTTGSPSSGRQIGEYLNP